MQRGIGQSGAAGAVEIQIIPVAFGRTRGCAVVVGVAPDRVILDRGERHRALRRALGEQDPGDAQGTGGALELDDCAGLHRQRHARVHCHVAGHTMHHIAFPSLVGRDRPAVIDHWHQGRQFVGSLGSNLDPVAFASLHTVEVVGEVRRLWIMLLPRISGVRRIVAQDPLVVHAIQHQRCRIGDHARIPHQVPAAIEHDSGTNGLGARDHQRHVGGDFDPEAHGLVQSGQIVGCARAEASPLAARRRVDVGPHLRVAAFDRREDRGRVGALRHQGQRDQVPALLERQIGRGCLLRRGGLRPGQAEGHSQS